MNSTASGFIPYEMKTSIIRITGYDKKELRGTLSNPYFGDDVFFDNVIQLLMLVEELLDSLHFPQRAMESRSFRKIEGEASALPATEEQKNARALATFKLNVLFRQGASWQGRLVWVDQKSEAQFRSVLELLKLIDNVLS